MATASRTSRRLLLAGVCVVILYALLATVAGHLGLDIHWRGSGRVVHAQTMDVGQPAPPKGGHVTFTAEPQSIAANHPATVLLHFHVDPDFHINSHTPKSEMLIPTKIAVEDLPAGNVSTVDFPQGTPYSFSFEPKNKLDVYSGDFTLVAHLTSKPGSQQLKAALHYQACDAAACYPPKLLPLVQPFTAR